MGVVYEAFDRERKTRVALKTLIHLDPDSLYRFKNEFRTLADIQHTNLVRLDELCCEEGRWFFTMELVKGVDFLAWVRPLDPEFTRRRASHQGPTVLMPTGNATGQLTTPAPPNAPSARFDEPRLRAALGQLAIGLDVLHRAGKIHCDVKPSNIMVTPEGRVVVLDFGLATDITQPKSMRDSTVVGTADYMAPEQAFGERVGPEADWYAAGVVLYEALTGRVPVSGRPIEVVVAKQRGAFCPPGELVEGVPSDLDRLCRDLLVVEPRERLSGQRLLLLLGADTADETEPISQVTAGAPFVGRKRELEVLRRAYSDSRKGRPVTALVLGESGLGKSSLVRRVLEDLEDEALVLSGRCYERESVPFKAFDGVVDALMRHLVDEHTREVLAILPDDAALMARLFPVLRRVSALAPGTPTTPEDPDPLVLRTRAFAAMRRLLARLAEREPLVVFIDDLQWADADSLALLSELMLPSEAPPVLLIGTVRCDGELPAALAKTVEALPDVRRLQLGGLDEAAARELASLLLGAGAHRIPQITREAAGHPLFLQELCYYSATSGEGGTARLRLDEALWSRAARLETPARQLLELVAVAGVPVTREVIARAVQLDGAELAAMLGILRASHFARASGERQADRIEPYHDRVREIVLARLGDEARRAYHSKLADALESSGAADLDPVPLVRHLEAAGKPERAALHAIRAARLASDALAFDRAADLYLTALRLARHSDGQRRKLLIALGQALVNAGRSPEAAHFFSEAAVGADAATRLDCQRRAAEQYLVSGHIDPGLAALRAVLAEVGVDLPKSPTRALGRLLWDRLCVRLGGLRWTPRDESQIAPHDLVRLDVYDTVALGLGMVDTIRGASFHQRGLRLALRLGEARRIGRFVALAAIYQAAEGWRREKQVLRLVDIAERITEETGDSSLRAWTMAATGTSNYLLAGRFKLALDQVREAEAAFRQLAGAAWEIDSLRFFGLFSLRHLGAIRELSRSYDEHVRDATRRGDRYAETTMAQQANLVLLADDAPDEAERLQHRSTWVPPTDAFHLQHWYSVRAHAEIGLYRGNLAKVVNWRRTLASLQRSLLERIQIVRAEAVWLCGRLVVAQGEVEAAIHCARRLERERIGYAAAWAHLLRAAIVSTPNEQVGHLREAIALSAKHDMNLCAASARLRLAELAGGNEANALRAEAETWMAGEGIRNPRRMVEVIAPALAKK
jgi:serine/threonine protein kinase